MCIDGLKFTGKKYEALIEAVVNKILNIKVG